MKRGDWIRLRGRKIAHLVVAQEPGSGVVNVACWFWSYPELLYTTDHDAPRCKKCLKAQARARKERGS